MVSCIQADVEAQHFASECLGVLLKTPLVKQFEIVLLYASRSVYIFGYIWSIYFVFVATVYLFKHV